ncbi:MAG TPA: hypothetical protein VFA14_06540, partial [Herbaspirillum sp.]|nr:hypothetical protein [Herbaspirillum sp.]
FSETQIFNAVLDRLAEESVLTTTDEKAVSHWLNRNYPLQRDVLLQRHTWNFAMARRQLAADTNKPPFEWSFQYLLPEDCLRVCPVTADGRRNSPPIPYVVEGMRILTNKSAPLNVRYISRMIDTNLFTPVFIDLLAQILAANFCYWVTGKANFSKQLMDISSLSFLEAARIDSLEGLPEEPYDDEIIMVR